MLFIKIRVYQEVLCKQLIRGLLLFIGLGLLYSLCILFIEFSLAQTLGKNNLVLDFIVVEMYLFCSFLFVIHYLNYLSLKGHRLQSSFYHYWQSF
jgi:hypothetical protein